MKRIFSCRDSVYGSLADALRLLPDAGIHSVELCCGDPEAIAGAHAEARERGIDIATVGLGVNLSNAGSVATYRRALEAAAGVDIKRAFTSIGAEGEPDDPALTRLLKEIADYAAGLGIVICLETHRPFGHNGSIALQTITAVDSPGLRLNFDTANIYYYNRDTDAVSELTKVSHLVASVHIKDTHGGYESPNFPVLGEGVVDFPTVFSMLDDEGFTGPYTLELEGPLTSGKSAEERHAAVAASMAHLRNIGVA